ncbi:MAG: hypothetical protein AAF514_09140 [Verrucomicrobiota bacterium]
MENDEQPATSLPDVETPGTFRERVAAFWSWYQSIGERFFDEIEAGRCGDLQPETSEIATRLFPGFDWVFGPGPEEKGGHAFTLSGNGDLHRQFLTDYWQFCAPEIPGWTFYAARQPGTLSDDMALTVDDQPFSFSEVWVTPEVDKEEEVVHLTAWHPHLLELEDKGMTVLYLMLDEILGEYGTDRRLGGIEIGDEKLAGAMPLTELREYIAELEATHGWQRRRPTEVGTIYEFKEPAGTFLRGDTVIGATSNFDLIHQYFGAAGSLEDPLEKTGAEFVFVAFPSAELPEGKEAAARGEMEDELAEHLGPDQAVVLGGAIGSEHSYIDILCLDGQKTISMIREFLQKHPLGEGSGIHFFAKGNEGRRIMI